MNNRITLKKYMKYMIAILAVLIIFICLLYNKYGNPFYKSKSNYMINVSFDQNQKVLDCVQHIKYTNNEDVNLNDVYFHLYPNSFHDKNNAPFEESDMKEAYPNGFSDGYIDIKSVKINGNEALYKLQGQQKDIMRIIPKKSLRPGITLNIEMKYTVKLPNCLSRFGYGDNTYNVANWYPIASVYDRKGWNNDPYYAVGDPFYSDNSDYTVNITVPKNYTIASTGSIQSITNNGDKKIWSIKAQNVRDFAWVASDKFKVKKAKAADTDVYSYYFTDSEGESSLKYAVDSINTFNKYFGKYPYKQFSVVESDFFIGGMEYPNLVIIDKSIYEPESAKMLEYVISHETAHQWWYGVVGNNEVDEPWLDESLTEFSTILYYGQKYGSDVENKMFQNMIVRQSYGRILNMDYYVPQIIAQPVYKFDSMLVYDSLVYGKGAMMFYQLRKEMGDDKFKTWIQGYYNMYKYKNSTGKALIDSCKKFTGKDWSTFFNKWLYQE